MTDQTRRFPLPRSIASRARMRAPSRRRDALALATLALMATAAPAATRGTRAAHAASAPTTAQILAPSQATVPDALPAESQVFRCGNSYSSHPCESGQKLDVADPRSEAQRAQAADVAVRDKRLAAWLEAGRRERERLPSASAPKKAVAAKAARPCKPSKTHACAPEAAASRRVVMLPKPSK